MSNERRSCSKTKADIDNLNSKTKKISLALSAFILLAVFGMYARHQINIDSCLDLGGRWDKNNSVCITK